MGAGASSHSVPNLSLVGTPTTEFIDRFCMRAEEPRDVVCGGWDTWLQLLSLCGNRQLLDNTYGHRHPPPSPPQSLLSIHNRAGVVLIYATSTMIQSSPPFYLFIHLYHQNGTTLFHPHLHLSYLSLYVTIISISFSSLCMVYMFASYCYLDSSRLIWFNPP